MSHSIYWSQNIALFWYILDSVVNYWKPNCLIVAKKNLRWHPVSYYAKDKATKSVRHDKCRSSWQALIFIEVMFGRSLFPITVQWMKLITAYLCKMSDQRCVTYKISVFFVLYCCILYILQYLYTLKHFHYTLLVFKLTCSERNSTSLETVPEEGVRLLILQLNALVILRNRYAAFCL